MHERVLLQKDYSSIGSNLKGITWDKNPKTPKGIDHGGDTAGMTQGGNSPGR